MFADNSQDIKDAVARVLRESGSTTLTLSDVCARIEVYTKMPDLLWPQEPFGPYLQAVKEAVEDYFDGKCALVQLPLASQSPTLPCMHKQE